MIIKELVTKLGFDVDDKALKDLDSGVTALTGGFLGLTSAVAAAGLSLFGLVKTTVDSLAGFKDLSEAVGVSVAQLQELAVFAGGAGVSQEELGTALTFLTKNIAAAKDGSEELQKAFAKVGISQNEITSGAVDTGSAMQRIAKQFDKLPEGPERTAFAMQVFGRAGARLIPMLNDLQDGLDSTQQAVLELSVATDEQVEAADKLGRSYDFLTMAVKGIIKSVGVQLVPVAQEIVATITDWIVKNKDLIKTNITGFVKGLSSSLKVSLGVANLLVTAFLGLTRAMGGLENATKFFLAALSVLSAGSVLFGIGKVVGALSALRISLISTQVAAAAVPIAIGAALVALFLIVEDIHGFFNGKDSVIGDLFKKFPEFAKAFGRIFSPIIEPVMELFDKISKGTLTWGDGLKLVGEAIFNFINTPLRAVYAIVSAITESLGNLAGNNFIGKALKGVSKFTGGIADVMGLGQTNVIQPQNSTFMPYAPGAKGEQLGPLAPMGAAKPAAATVFDVAKPSPAFSTGVTPQAVSRVGGPVSNVQSQNNNVNVQQTFTFPPGTDPARAAPAITQAVDSGLDGFLRNAARATK